MSKDKPLQKLFPSLPFCYSISLPVLGSSELEEYLLDETSATKLLKRLEREVALSDADIEAAITLIMGGREPKTNTRPSYETLSECPNGSVVINHERLCWPDGLNEKSLPWFYQNSISIFENLALAETIDTMVWQPAALNNSRPFLPKKSIWEDASVAVLSTFLKRQIEESGEVWTFPEQLFKEMKKTIKLTLPTPEPLLKLYAILDPLSPQAQTMLPILKLLNDDLSAEINIVFNPAPELKEYPLNRWYKQAIADRSNSRPGQIIFPNLETPHTLTAALHAPEKWLSRSHKTVTDLDNIVVGKNEGSVIMATYQLTDLFEEGRVIVAPQGKPFEPSGLVLSAQALSPRSQETDTIVMGTLNYFQLRTRPGKFAVKALAHARSPSTSSEDQGMYEALAWDTHSPKDDKKSIKDQVARASRKLLEKDDRPYVPMDVTSLSGSRLFRLRVVKRGGDDAGSRPLLERNMISRGIIDNAKAALLSINPLRRWSDCKETLHVFSLASGHMYERLLRIMILSVRSHTKCPLKFWFLDNFLSPKFREIMPAMAARSDLLPSSSQVLSFRYNLEYEYVTYKWPSWVRKQTEKQRQIWAYKILYLDVLFPSDLKKVIYIDADQVVRADIRELWDMDLKGCPYAFTPFCDSRPETDGYRFWKTGYWASHLQGKPYHISALYVVDLERFRALGVGDSLRTIYMALSADKNSLANLDQDLPNYAQHQIPIFSLPQEWLWCESWCSDKSLKTAKTIDLCNNPMTKEPKLSQARRILPEWTKYDQVSNKTNQGGRVFSFSQAVGNQLS